MTYVTPYREGRVELSIFEQFHDCHLQKEGRPGKALLVNGAGDLLAKDLETTVAINAFFAPATKSGGLSYGFRISLTRWLQSAWPHAAAKEKPSHCNAKLEPGCRIWSMPTWKPALPPFMLHISWKRAAQPHGRDLQIHSAQSTSIFNNEVVTQRTRSEIGCLPNKRHFSPVKPSVRATLLC